MKHSYFSLKFIKLLYRECDLFERLELEHALEEDGFQQGEYQRLKNVKDSLPDVLFQPTQESLDHIMEYAQV